MKTNEQSAAEEFSRKIDGLLAGSLGSGAGEDEGLRLAGEMVALARGTAPEAGFTAALEKRLLREGAARREDARPPAARKWVLTGAGLALAAGVVTLAVIVLGGRTPHPDSGIAGEVVTPTAPVGAVETSTPSAPPLLPSLAELLGGGFGGQGGTTPEDLELVLTAELPQGPGELMVYSLLEQGPLTVESVRRLGESFGMQGGVYMPLWMADAEAAAGVGYNSYVMVDGARQVTAEGTDRWTYFDRQGRSLFYQGHFRQPVDLPGEAEAEAIARSTLEGYGLLVPESSVRLSGLTVSFYALAGGYEVSEPYARVLLGDGGRVESVEYRPYPVRDLGEYALRTAEQAYALIASGSQGGEMWFAGYSPQRPWGQFSGLDPLFWVRARADGERADLYGDAFVLLPTAEGQAPYVQLQGVELRGSQEEIADFVVGMGGPIHAWGTIEQAEGYQILHVGGWEAGQALIVPGIIRTLGGQSRLEGHDGMEYIMPDLPADLANGAEVFVQGGLAGSVLDWDLIQAMPDPAEPGCQACGTAGGTGMIESVELVYFIPPASYAPTEARPGVDYRAIQPVWRFRGRDGDGGWFEIYVQAVLGAVE